MEKKCKLLLYSKNGNYDFKLTILSKTNKQTNKKEIILYAKVCNETIRDFLFLYVSKLQKQLDQRNN